MKILMINVVCGVKSTGRICTDIALQLEKQGHEVKIAYGRDVVPAELERFAYRIGNDWDVRLHGIRTRLFDGMGLGSKAVTERFVEWIINYNPDVIHLHNIHGYYIHIPTLFNYLKNCNKKIIWTLHDCWSFTGHCMYFNYENCDRWKTGCGGCPQNGVYPKRLGPDRSAFNHNLKRHLFANIKDLTVVTPSEWLAKLVQQSFMGQYPVQVIHNGVDTSTFKPTESDILDKLGISGKKMLLGVAAVWDRRKGLKDFIELSKIIDDSYRIVLVGLSKDQVRALPEGVIGLTRTDSVEELVKLYSAAYAFINPTYEDNYPTTHLEAIACNTPVITYDTGGSSESADMYGITLHEKTPTAIASALPDILNIKKQAVNIDNATTIEAYLKLY